MTAPAGTTGRFAPGATIVTGQTLMVDGGVAV
jgi:hypothetical protein